MPKHQIPSSKLQQCTEFQNVLARSWRFGFMSMNQRILIVEDELPMRTALKDCLEAEGYRVLTAADGEIGLEKALEEKPDLILLDIMMPRLDGYSLCGELRRLGNRVPILMLTAKGLVEG